MEETETAKREARVPPEGDPLRYAEATVPRCPACHARQVVATSGAKWQSDNGAEHGQQYSECKACGWRFITLFS